MDVNTTDTFTPENKSSCRFKKIFIWGLLFILGLVTGLALFLPRDLHWQYLMNKVSLGHEDITLSGYTLSRAGWNKAFMENLVISFGEQTYTLPEVRIRLGLSPRIKAVVNTGPEIILALEPGKKISARGEINLSRLVPDQEMQGSLWVDGNVSFQSWNAPPSRGTVELKSSTPLNLNISQDIQGLVLQAELTENRLEIKELKARKPVDFSCSGHALLNWNTLGNSTYQVRGQFTLSGKSSPFEQKGRLSRLMP
ncbi:MAG: hypothetical protein R6X11_10455 [Desulfonatronovibrio sp.]